MIWGAEIAPDMCVIGHPMSRACVTRAGCLRMLEVAYQPADTILNS